MNDNRNYMWEEDCVTLRPEYAVIERWVPPGAQVIDLGCGNGSLLRLLREQKKIVASGIDISESGVAVCRRHGLNVLASRIDARLTNIPDRAFDIAICNVTIQMVEYPEVLLSEMKRIARRQIVSFPNFAYVLNRLELLWLGRMPRRMLGGYSWYNTGHYHQLAVRDFAELLRLVDLKIIARAFQGPRGRAIPLMPNLLAKTALFLLESRS
jgi:methionine biosynthesis protein MetW